MNTWYLNYSRMDRWIDGWIDGRIICGRQSGRVKEATTFSERRVSDLERGHRDVLRERMLSEQRLREELLLWRHYHPEVNGTTGLNGTELNKNG